MIHIERRGVPAALEKLYPAAPSQGQRLLLPEAKKMFVLCHPYLSREDGWLKSHGVVIYM